MKILFLNITLLFSLLGCNGQTTDKKSEHNINSTNTGIVYFSSDNGQSWKNQSKGLPQNVRIALGGISTFDSSLALATKESGVFIFQVSDSTWHAIPTDQEIIDGNIGCLISYKSRFFLGTQNNGVYYRNEINGLWKIINEGLKNLTIGRFLVINDKLFVCTNDGFYELDEMKKERTLLYGEAGLQVNGATFFNEDFYLATNEGIFKSDKINK